MVKIQCTRVRPHSLWRFCLSCITQPETRERKITFCWAICSFSKTCFPYFLPAIWTNLCTSTYILSSNGKFERASVMICVWAFFYIDRNIETLTVGNIIRKIYGDVYIVKGMYYDQGLYSSLWIISLVLLWHFSASELLYSGNWFLVY